MTFGVWEIVIVLIIVLVIFGAGRLGEVGGALGKGVRNFRSASSEEPAAVPPPTVSAPIPVASGPVVGENKCLSCATINPPGQVFCGQCGTRLTLAA